MRILFSAGFWRKLQIERNRKKRRKIHDELEIPYAAYVESRGKKLWMTCEYKRCLNSRRPVVTNVERRRDSVCLSLTVFVHAYLDQKVTNSRQLFCRMRHRITMSGSQPRVLRLERQRATPSPQNPKACGLDAARLGSFIRALRIAVQRRRRCQPELRPLLLQ